MRLLPTVRNIGTLGFRSSSRQLKLSTKKGPYKANEKGMLFYTQLKPKFSMRATGQSTGGEGTYVLLCAVDGKTTNSFTLILPKKLTSV